MEGLLGRCCPRAFQNVHDCESVSNLIRPGRGKGICGIPTSACAATFAQTAPPSSVDGSHTTGMISSLANSRAVFEERVWPYTMCPARTNALATGRPIKPVVVSFYSSLFTSRPDDGMNICRRTTGSEDEHLHVLICSDCYMSYGA